VRATTSFAGFNGSLDAGTVGESRTNRLLVGLARRGLFAKVRMRATVAVAQLVGACSLTASRDTIGGTLGPQTPLGVAASASDRSSTL
jgi:hypothetical protein